MLVHQLVAAAGHRLIAFSKWRSRNGSGRLAAASSWTVTEAGGIGTLDDATASYAAGYQLLDETTSNVNGCSQGDGFSVP